jgi:hypothetical protein
LFSKQLEACLQIIKITIVKAALKVAGQSLVAKEKNFLWRSLNRDSYKYILGILSLRVFLPLSQTKVCHSKQKMLPFRKHSFF